MAVYLVLRRGDEILFSLRAGTGYRDGEYGLPSGKVDPGELLSEAMIREAQEEIAVELDVSSLELVHMAERDTPTGRWLDFYYLCSGWQGTPRNAEPHKCEALEWLSSNHPGVIDYIRHVLKEIDAGVSFSHSSGE